MTVIAWDGHTLASDRMCVVAGETMVRIRKIFRVGHLLVAGSGEAPQIREMVEWIGGDCQIDRFPAAQRNTETWCPILVIDTRNGSMVRYECSPFPVEYQNQTIFAIGSGAEYAWGAMAAGADAIEAVRIANRLCYTCGMGVHWIRLDGLEGYLE